MGPQMKTLLGAILICCAAVVAAGTTLADDLFIYPAKGQSAQQQDTDKWQCRSWATQQTGFDPAARPQASSPPPVQQAPSTGTLRGAGRGAAVGAIGGAIGGNAGKGAAIGAVAGGALGTMRRNDQLRQNDAANQQWAQQNMAQYE